MSIEKRPAGDGYNVRWRDTTGKQRSKKVTLWRDAVALDGEMKRKKAMGELIVHERGTVVLEDFWQLWVERYGRVHITARTLEGYEWLWVKHLAPALGRHRLRDLTTEDISDLVSKLSAKLAAATVRKAVVVLQGVLQRAVEWQYIPANPCRGARKPRVISREGVALNDLQLMALCDELRDLRAKTVVLILAFTGLRPGELRALLWSDVTADSILVTKAISHNVSGPTKTYGRRTVAIPPGFVTLKEWRLIQGRLVAPNRLVMPRSDGRGVWTDEAWRNWQRKVFAPAAKRAGFPDLVAYDLRHTFASRLIAEGRDIYWIARQMGHSPTQTLTTYGHLLESRYATTVTEPAQRADGSSGR